MTIEQDVQKPVTPAHIDLFEIDLTLFGGNILYLVGMVGDNYTKVQFGGQDYDPFPIAIDSFEQVTDGAPARPRLMVANVNKLFGALAYQYRDIVGAEVVYIRTFENYLNQPARISRPPMKFVIGQKISHDRQALIFSLRSPLDKERAFMPKRQMLRKDYPGLGVNKRLQ